MPIARFIASLVAAVVVFHAGFGLLFARRFRRDALLPAPPTRDFGVTVEELDDGRIRLASPDGTNRNHPGVLGLLWAGGYGQVSDIVQRAAGATTRQFEVVEGAPPEPGAEVDLDVWAYQSDPSDVGLEWLETSFTTDIGTLPAWVIPADGDTWAIHVHGWRAARQEAIRMLPAYHRAQVTSMVISYRNDPGAPVDPSGHYRFGLSEWIDVEAAVDEALANGAKQVVLAAYSTGAAAVMAFMERSRLATCVAGLVLDAPNINMTATVHHAASEMRLPVLTLPMPRTVTEVAMAIADLRWDVDWDAIDYTDRAHLLEVPILVFHGTADRRVPLTVSRTLEAANPNLVDLVVVPDAGHVASWNADPEAYEARIEQFLETIVD